MGVSTKSFLFEAGRRFIGAILGLLILRRPLAEFLQAQVDFSYRPGVDIWILTALFFLGMLLVVLPQKIESSRRYQILVLGGVMLVVFIPMAVGWPLPAFSGMTLILFAVSLRSSRYGGKIDFGEDVPRLLIIYLVLQGAAGIAGERGAAPGEILLFLLLIPLCAFLFKLKPEEFKDRASAFKIILPFYGVILILAGLLSRFIEIPLSGVESVMAFLQNIYFTLVEMIALPLSYLVIPIYRIISLFEIEDRESIQPEGEEGIYVEPGEARAEFQETAEEMFSSGPLAAILVILFVIITVWLIRRYLPSPSQDDEAVKEERENLAGRDLLQSDIQNLWTGMRSKLQRRKTVEPDYDLSSPCERVRYSYFLFLKSIQGRISRSPAASPREYYSQLCREEDLQHLTSLMRRLTGLYEKARYGQEISPEEAKEAEKIKDEILEE